jgi:hypothetical protein
MTVKTDSPLTQEFLNEIVSKYPENTLQKKHDFEMFAEAENFNVYLTIDLIWDKNTGKTYWYTEVNGGSVRSPQTVEHFWSLCQAIGLVMRDDE